MAITIKSKIVVIGAGNVGEAIGYTLMLRRQASDIVLVDLNEKRAKGSALDIAHGTACLLYTSLTRSTQYSVIAIASGEFT